MMSVCVCVRAEWCERCAVFPSQLFTVLVIVSCVTAAGPVILTSKYTLAKVKVGKQLLVVFIIVAPLHKDAALCHKT